MWKMKNRPVKVELSMPERKKTVAPDEKAAADSCPYNDGVACTKKQCEGCGWNPEVARKRDEKLRSKLGMGTNG